MRHALLPNSSWQIQQVRLSTWLEFSSVVEEKNMQDLLPPSAAGSWRCFPMSVWLCCMCFKELSLVCLSSCSLQQDNRLKLFSQCLHLYGFIPVWVPSCLLQSDNWKKPLLQCLHTCMYMYGFTPMRVSSCPLEFDDWLKHWSQCLHAYGFSPVWVRSCCL